MHSYIIKPGDSFYLIAQQLGISVQELKALNNYAGDLLYPNQKINIPDLSLAPGLYGPRSSGRPVREIQLALSAIGYALDIDGIFGAKTEEIIYQIQKKYPEIPLDGIYGPETKRVLEHMLETGFHIVQNPDSIQVLVNKDNGLPHNYIPKKLVIPDVPFTIEGVLPQKLMREEAAQALKLLFNQAAKENITLFAVSAYRSYDRQAEIFARNYRSSPAIANILSARAGESEHQTGLGVDLTGPSVNYRLTQRFGDTREGKWLVKNAPSYGFILRYPADKEGITGYVYEPWHIRYVGRAAALMSVRSHLEFFW